MRRIFMLFLLGTLASACSQANDGPGPMGTPDADTNCEGRGDDYFAGMKKPSPDGTLTAELTSADPAPPANVDNNTWTVKVTTKDGAPIEGATIVGAPFMIDHGHGAPSQIATEISGGSYTLGPLALRMNGLWQVTLKITPSGGTESDVVFSFCIRPN